MATLLARIYNMAIAQRLESVKQDLQFACRGMRRSPAFTTVAVMTLSLGIGGTTAIFTLMHAVMLRSLPVSDPARLYRIGDGDDGRVEGGPQGRWGMFSFPLYERLKATTPEFEDITAFYAGVAQLSVRRQGAEDDAQASAGGIRHRNLFLHSWRGRVQRPCVRVG
jgi:hypothetical protein